MKRFSVFGLCLVAAFAFSVLVASSAFAAKKEVGELYLVTKGGAAHLGTPKATITSTSNEGEGRITSATSGSATSLFHGVEIENTGLKCTSAGQPTGTVETKPLTENTGCISKTKNEAGVDFKAASGELLAEFSCEGGISAKVRASVIGHVTPLNSPSLTSELNLIPNGSGKANSPEAFDGGSKDVLESELSEAPGVWSESVQDQEKVAVTNHGNSSVCKTKKGVEKCKPLPAEFNTAVGPTPEFGRCVKGKVYTDSACTHAATGKEKGKYAFEPAS
jgi:hypothetical protein